MAGVSQSSAAPSPPRIAIIGGGITGLAAAFHLREIAPDCRASLFESSPRFGGVLQSTRQDGFLIEHSADMFLREKPWAGRLCERLGISQDLTATEPDSRRAFVLRKGSLHPVPEGYQLMAFRRWWPILSTPLLSWKAKLRMACECLIRKRRDSSDESLESFAVRRMGREAFDYLIQPLVSGIYTADPRRLSMQAALKRFWLMEQLHGSLICGMRRRGRRTTSDALASGARYGLFAAPQHGMQTIVDAIVGKLPPEWLQANSRVCRVSRPALGRFRLHFSDNRPDEDFDGVLCALPAPFASELFQQDFLELSAGLKSIPYANSVVAVLAIPEAELSRARSCSGIVVPLCERRRILAISFASRKFKGRAPEGMSLVRVFMGGALDPQCVELRDEQIANMIKEELADILGLRHEPKVLQILRWSQAMPQYELGHREKVAQIRGQVRIIPGLELAGNAYRGVGIPDCIHQGERAIERLIEQLRPAAKLA